MEPYKSEKGMTLEIALAHVDGDLQLLSDLASIFVQDYPNLLDEARNSILNNDYAGLERAAHTMKGRFAFFGVGKMRDRMLVLELMGRNQDLTGAMQALTGIEADMKAILPEFESLIRTQS